MRLVERKSLVRGLIPSQQVTVTMPGFRRRLSLHVFHPPDPGRVFVEGGYWMDFGTGTYSD